MSQTPAYTPTDRRPIPQREQAVWKAAAAALADRGVSANAISVAGMVFCLLAGVCLWLTGHSGGVTARALWLGAGVLVPLRLICNMLDGMVALKRGVASPVGELYNEVPDRISDLATLIGLGFAAGSSPVLGALAGALAVMTAYVRAAAKVAGAPQDYRGPMAKPQRMWVVIAACAAMAVLPERLTAWPVGGRVVGLPEVALWIIALGCVITCVRRVHGAAKFLGSRPSPR